MGASLQVLSQVRLQILIGQLGRLLLVAGHESMKRGAMQGLNVCRGFKQAPEGTPLDPSRSQSMSRDSSGSYSLKRIKRPWS